MTKGWKISNETSRLAFEHNLILQLGAFRPEAVTKLCRDRPLMKVSDVFRYGTQSNFAVYKADYIALYVDTIRTIVRQEDPSRPYAVSSPSNGLRSEEEGYIAETPGSELYGDGQTFIFRDFRAMNHGILCAVHYYNYLGNGWDWNTYPKPRMATEYGFQALPSVHAWSEAASPIGNFLIRLNFDAFQLF